MREITEFQRKRAVNLIWNASGTHDYFPDCKAYDDNGNADVYWNTIIGAAHKHYEYDKLLSLFEACRQYEEGDSYEGLIWLGLENCCYEREVKTRPVLASLRTAYAKRFLAVHGNTVLDDFHLYDWLAVCHYRRVLGEQLHAGKYDKKLLDELEFPADLSTDEIVSRSRELMERWFQIRLSEQKRQFRLPSWISLKRNRYSPSRMIRFGIGLLDRNISGNHTEVFDDPTADLRSKLSASELRAFMTSKYGLSALTEQEIFELERALCCGNHEFCHLHVTKGMQAKGKIQNGFEALQRLKEADQIQKNRAYYQANLSQNNTTIAKLAGKIQNAVLLHLQPASVKSNTGELNGQLVWRAPVLNDGRVFVRNEQGNMGDLSVDILLDASDSQRSRQEIISSQAYMIEQALTRCAVPCRVMSFCSMTGYTILRIYRDYLEPRANDRVFEYVSNGCNRDGLAIRTATNLMEKSPWEHKLLIVLSDVKPHDIIKIRGADDKMLHNYERDAGITDTAIEVRRARTEGIAVICVFTGDDQDIPSAKLVYGRDFARLQGLEKFADTVGMLIQNQLRNL